MSGPFYLNINGVPEGWAVSQITVDGTDVTDEAIDLKGANATARVVLTDRLTTLSGMVQPRGDRASYSVVVFLTMGRDGRIRLDTCEQRALTTRSLLHRWSASQ